MRRSSFIPLALVLLLLFSTAGFGQIKGIVSTAKGESQPVLVAHPLTWWTRDPLRRDADGDLMIGYKEITAADYRVQEELHTIGQIGGRRILQLLVTIHPGQRVTKAGFGDASSPPTVWKSLLVQQGAPGTYIEIYRLQADAGTYVIPFKAAAIYGRGANAILTTYDSDSGNGGGCTDGYWWFDRGGPHAIDFSSVYESITHAIPANSTFTEGCWTMHPEDSTMKSWVQRKDAECHACGGLGEVEATYKIDSGKAEPLKVEFSPEQEQ